MSLFGSNTTTTNNAPWTGSQPYLKRVMTGAQRAFNQGQGFNAPSFSTVAGQSGATTKALAGINQMAKADEANNPLTTSFQTVNNILTGQGGVGAKYNDLYDQASNPYFEKALQNQVDLTGNDVQRQFSGLGRTGSGADTGVLTDQLGKLRTDAMSQNWNQNIANQRGILGDFTGAKEWAVGAAPGAYAQKYIPWQIQQGVGAQRDAYNQRTLDAKTNAFNINQQAPWNRLSAFSGLVGGGQLDRANTQTTTPPSNLLGGIAGGALGGASIGNQMLPGLGAGYGAIGGGLLGLLSGL